MLYLFIYQGEESRVLYLSYVKARRAVCCIFCENEGILSNQSAPRLRSCISIFPCPSVVLVQLQELIEIYFHFRSAQSPYHSLTRAGAFADDTARVIGFILFFATII